VTLRRFEVRWMNVRAGEGPGRSRSGTGLYAQDSAATSREGHLRTAADALLRRDGLQNVEADAFTFRDENGDAVQYQTGKLPDANILWSPRVGFNWDVTGNRSTQVRGGTGVFTGPPAYVWISNQIGNTGVLTGFAQLDNTKLRPWNPSPAAYKPTDVTGAPASSYELALTDPDFKFPQTWRTNLAVDQKLPWGLIGTGEFLYNRDVNGIYYINANLPAAQTAFVGADSRPRYTSNRIHSSVSNAIVLKNQDVGRSWTASASLQKNFRQGLFKTAYTYYEAKNTVDPGSIASGSWFNNAHSGDPNDPGLGYSAQGQRFFVAGSYRLEYLKFGATTFSAFVEGFSQLPESYRFSGDLNGDGGTNNDLVYVHRDTSEMNFVPITGSVAFSSAQQAAAWDAYISQDGYLSGRRGQYAERNGAKLPWVWRLDFAVAQDLFRDLGGARHSLQFRADFLNFANLLSSDWGVGQRLVNSQPLISRGADAQGQAQYPLRVVNHQLLTKSLESTANETDVYRIQFSLRYSFN
jgi:hypothetical protein